MMIPLRILFRLQSPMIVPSHPIHLDALLAWVAVDRTGDLAAQESLPLERHGYGDRWCWKASWIEFGGITQRWQAESIRRFNPWQRAADYAMGALREYKRIAPGSGPDKAYQLFQPVMAASVACGYCIGDEEAVRDMLQDVTHLGKWRRVGYGELSSVEVTRLDDGGNLLWQHRIMPEPLPGYVKVWARLRPPYWERTGRVQAYRPVAVPENFFSQNGEPL